MGLKTHPASLFQESYLGVKRRGVK